MKVLKKIGLGIWAGIAFVLLYAMLVIDRAILVFTPFVDSYSAQKLSALPDRESLIVVIRVSIVVIITTLILLFKLIF